MKGGTMSERKEWPTTSMDGAIVGSYAVTHKGNGETHFNEVRWSDGAYRTFDSVGVQEEGRYTYDNR